MAVPEYIIEQVRTGNDIVSVISERIRVEKAGVNYRAICPFHKEKTPSFIISPEKQIYHCFGCGEGGNVYGFIMKYDNLNFFDALKKLAGRAGILLPAGTAGTDERRLEKHEKERELFYEINRRVAEFYNGELKTGKEAGAAREYLRKRGIAGSSVDDFKIGYSAASFDSLLKFSRKEGYPPETMKNLGLIVYSDRKQEWVDRFIDRIMFPICDSDGRVIAFGGRSMSGDYVKYVNSPETALFGKSRVLYGINLARTHIREEGSMILVEGYMDVVTAHQFGFKNTVATMGTAFSREHAGIIGRYTDSISLVYDSDVAGAKATLRGLGMLVGTSMKVSVVVLPAGDDPDSFLQKKGSGEFKKAIDNGMDLLDYEIKSAAEGMDLNTASGKVEVARKVLPVIMRLNSEINKEEGIKKLAGVIGVGKDVLRREMAAAGTGEKIEESMKVPARQLDAITKLERTIAQALLKYPDHVSTVFKQKRYFAEELTSREFSLIIDAVLQVYELGKRVEPAAVLGYLYERYGGEKDLLEKLNGTVTELVMEKAEYRNPGKAMEKLVEDFFKVQNKREYDRLKNVLPSDIEKGNIKEAELFVMKYRQVKGTKSDGRL